MATFVIKLIRPIGLVVIVYPLSNVSLADIKYANGRITYVRKLLLMMYRVLI